MASFTPRLYGVTSRTDYRHQKRAHLLRSAYGATETHSCALRFRPTGSSLQDCSRNLRADVRRVVLAFLLRLVRLKRGDIVPWYNCLTTTALGKMWYLSKMRILDRRCFASRYPALWKESTGRRPMLDPRSSRNIWQRTRYSMENAGDPSRDSRNLRRDFRR